MRHWTFMMGTLWWMDGGSIWQYFVDMSLAYIYTCVCIINYHKAEWYTYVLTCILARDAFIFLVQLLWDPCDNDIRPDCCQSMRLIFFLPDDTIQNGQCYFTPLGSPISLHYPCKTSATRAVYRVIFQIHLNFFNLFVSSNFVCIVIGQIITTRTYGTGVVGITADISVKNANVKPVETRHVL